MPKAYHPLEARFFRAKNELSFFNCNGVRDKEQEQEICFMIREVEEYGFRFFPEMYVEDKIEELEAIAKTRLTKRKQK